MSKEETLKLELKVVLTIIAMIAGVIAAHFYGISEAKNYTDFMVRQLNSEREKKLEKVLNKLDEMHKTLTQVRINQGVTRE